MSRIIHTYEAPDLSALARTIKRELEARSETPGHVEILNILSRAAGFRNYQHLKASRTAETRLATVPEPQPEVDFRRVETAARCFDVNDVLLRWPGKTNLQALCLWKLWSFFPAEVEMTERQVNDLLKRHHAFGDHVLIRREMVNMRLLSRTADCRSYRRVERRPPPDALALIRGSGAHATAAAAADRSVPSSVEG
ncbi:MAG: DUF2087 domain-containing protein [Alphaproteobacteria bacterium]|nr:DUF2087 domain-containing protein [Rhizobiaceae bacterium]MBU3959876.1 DUF2087 domain-containing protein [Alphaproteobacteria bacterium]MBU4050812.1 DUF2087 domain-containing protein [Alphaproteobacteria bacterium]MBU4087229.1 DUF2087 domain-containing protein [Alphaproteobacteria bacterium]MBU4155533.1 DUF2087 domain-containing protein [Alphaproteobacteria bacterium]